MTFGVDDARGSGRRPRSGGRVDTRRAVRLGVAALAVVLAVVFMAQNNDRVELNFLMLEVSTRLWVGLLVTLVLGGLLGQAVEALWARRRGGRD
jgi:lipopolysaccharide assembly protein A